MAKQSGPKRSGEKADTFPQSRFGFFIMGVICTGLCLIIAAITYVEVLRPEIHMLTHGRWTTGVVTDVELYETPGRPKYAGEYVRGVVFTDHLGRERTINHTSGKKRNASWGLFTYDPRGDNEWVLYEPTEDGQAMVFSILDHVVRPLGLIAISLVFFIFALAGFFETFGLFQAETAPGDDAALGDDTAPGDEGKRG